MQDAAAVDQVGKDQDIIEGPGSWVRGGDRCRRKRIPSIETSKKGGKPLKLGGARISVDMEMTTWYSCRSPPHFFVRLARFVGLQGSGDARG